MSIQQQINNNLVDIEQRFRDCLQRVVNDIGNAHMGFPIIDSTELVLSGEADDGTRFQIQLKMTTEESDFCDDSIGEVEL